VSARTGGEDGARFDVRTLAPSPDDARALQLPPGLSHVSPPDGDGAFTFAMRNAEALGAGTLVWAPDPEQIELAVVLEPEEPLRTARRAFLLGMSALVDALASAAPPDKSLTVDWPDVIRFDGARIGGGRLGWPSDASEDAVPPFLVFGGSLIMSKAGAGDPGLTPETTSLEEEAFEPGSDVTIVEAFARYLLRAVHASQGGTLSEAIAGLLSRLRRTETGRLAVDDCGNLVADRGPVIQELVPALDEPSWLDPRTGKVRL
jgi:hypothetical protein